MDNFIDKLAQKFTAGEVIRANSVAEEKELKRLRQQVAEYENCLQEMRKVQMINTQTAQNLHDLMVESADSLRNLTKESADSFRNLTKESADSFQNLTKESTDTVQKVTAESTESFQKLTAESMAKIADIQLESEAQKAESKKIVENAVLAMEQMEEKVVKMQETVASLTETLVQNQKEIEEWFQKADDFLHKENVKVYRNVQAVVVEEVGNKADAIMKAQEEAVQKSNKPVLLFAALGFAAAAASLILQIFEAMGIALF